MKKGQQKGLIEGVGINDGTYPTKTKEYQLWRGIFCRCFNERELLNYPRYRGCTVSDNFKYYSYFYEWCNRQIGFSNDGWHLDKDILIKGNKVYSENNCVFVPSEINMLFTKANSIRGLYPIGVSMNYKKFRARARIDNKEIVIGSSYNTPNEAFYAYKEVKELYIKTVAERYKDVIDQRVYEALYKYQVDIID